MQVDLTHPIGIAAAMAAVLSLGSAPMALAQNDTAAAPPATAAPGDKAPPANQQQPGAAPASAQPVKKSRQWFEAHGSIFERYRAEQNKDNGGHDSRASVTYFNVTGTINLSDLLSVYGRIGGEGLTARGQTRDFNTAYYKGDSGFRGALALDQFGVIYHDVPHGLRITLGRQDNPLDASGTMYDQSFKVGQYTFLDGVSVVQKVGSGTVEGYAFSEDQYRDVDGNGQATRNSLYALRMTTGVGSLLPESQRGATGSDHRITLGATVGKFVSSSVNQAAGVQSTTNYAADIAWQPSSSWLFKAEYGRSDASTNRDLYYGLAKYRLTKRDSLTVYTYHVGQFADMGQDSGYPNNYRGTRYFAQHDFSKSTSLILYHEVNRQLNGAGTNTSDQMTLAYSF